MNYTIECRRRKLINTDPQRRCYYGVHFSYEIIWTPWDWLEVEVPEDRVEQRLKFWRELNQGAVEARGESALKEFRKVPT